MIAIVAATVAEAQPLIERLGAVPEAGAPVPTYRFALAGGGQSGAILISGMGPQAASRAAELAAGMGATVVLNIGVCGALCADFAPGELCRVVEAVDGDALAAGRPARRADCGLPAPRWAPLRPATLASADRPVFEPARRDALAPHAQLVDMEGFALAYACRKLGIACCLLKAVSDRADSDGRRDIAAALAPLSKKLSDVVAAGLDELPPPAGAVARAASLVKFEHTIFSLPMLLAGAVVGASAAAGRAAWPSWRVLALVVLAGAGARTLAMAANRLLDRRLDALNPRTAWRELPSGRMSTRAALAVGAAGLAVYLAAAAALGPLCLALSPAPAVCLIGYPLLKRFTSLCHFGVGVCLGMAPLAASVAASGTLNVPPGAWLLAAFTFAWISGFDIIYAGLDVESDRRTGVHSLPARAGGAVAEAVALGLHAMAAAAVIWLWLIAGGTLAGVMAALALAALAAGHLPFIPPATRFFPISAVACLAASLVPVLGGAQ